MPNDFPIMYFAEKIAWKPNDHVIECINVSYLISSYQTRGVVELSDAAIPNCQVKFIHSQLNKVYEN